MIGYGTRIRSTYGFPMCLSRTYLRINTGDSDYDFYSADKNIFHSIGGDVFWIYSGWLFKWARAVSTLVESAGIPESQQM